MLGGEGRGRAGHAWESPLTALKCPSPGSTEDAVSELGAGRWEGSSAFGQGDLRDAPGKERRICLRGSVCTEFSGPPPLPAPKAWLEHKGPLCGT